MFLRTGEEKWVQELAMAIYRDLAQPFAWATDPEVLNPHITSQLAVYGSRSLKTIARIVLAYPKVRTEAAGGEAQTVMQRLARAIIRELINAIVVRKRFFAIHDAYFLGGDLRNFSILPLPAGQAEPEVENDLFVAYFVALTGAHVFVVHNHGTIQYSRRERDGYHAHEAWRRAELELVTRL
jgi:hypothetical protein